jgi:putative ubiquitin-RnfH superfamily antitoxin RatB of RatAB toxin-antitoxin module
MKVSIAYATPQRQVWNDLEVAVGATVRQAIEISGLLSEFPEIDLAKNKVGIFGDTVALDRVLAEGDRVEIYRPLTADPKLVKKRRK